jgi:hypothetical protein
MRNANAQQQMCTHQYRTYLHLPHWLSALAPSGAVLRQKEQRRATWSPHNTCASGTLANSTSPACSATEAQSPRPPWASPSRLSSTRSSALPFPPSAPPPALTLALAGRKQQVRSPSSSVSLIAGSSTRLGRKEELMKLSGTSETWSVEKE